MQRNAPSRVMRRRKPGHRLARTNELVRRSCRARTLNALRAWAHAVKRDIVAVWIAGRDPRVIWYVRALAVAVAAYAFSPIDLIPDFIPVLGLLDDLILVPIGILLVVKLVPPDLLNEFREAAELRWGRVGSTAAAAIIISIWAAAFLISAWFAWSFYIR